MILGAIMEHFMVCAPILKSGGSAGETEDDEFFEATDTEPSPPSRS